MKEERTHGKTLQTQSEPYHGPHGDPGRSHHLHDHGVHHRPEPQPADQLRRGDTPLERRVPGHLHRLRGGHHGHGVPGQQALRHGAGHGPQQLLRRHRREHRRHAEHRLRKCVPGRPGHHPGGGRRVHPAFRIQHPGQDRPRHPPGRAAGHRPRHRPHAAEHRPRLQRGRLLGDRRPLLRHAGFLRRHDPQRAPGSNRLRLR